ATIDDVHTMLQNLLTARFHMKVHFDKKEMQAYTLVVAKGGLKMKPAAAGSAGAAPPATARMSAKSMHTVMPHLTMAAICATLSRQISEPVIDQTGLAGTYDLDLEFSREG